MKFLSVLALGLIGCSQVPVKTQDRVQVRDVPFQARTPEGDLRKRIVILPFLDGTTRKSESATEAGYRALVNTLTRSGQFVIVPATEIPVDVQQWRNDQEYNLSQVTAGVTSLGVSAIIEGKILDLRAQRLSDSVGLMRSLRAQMDANVRVRVWGTRGDKELINEIRTARIESNTTRFAKQAYTDRNLEEDPQLVEDVVAKAFQGLAPTIASNLQKLSWEGRVAVVRGDKIYLNAGRASGLQIGDILKVTGQTEEIFDPETGSLIGKIPGHMKGTLEIASYFGQDGAVAIIHSGGNFKENDRVEMY